MPVTFPSNPTKFRSDFVGWFTEETGGEEIDSYDKLEDTVIHAHWTKHIPDITTPESIDHPDENDQYEFPVNNYSKDSENIGTVTFVLNNGESNIVRDIIKNYIPNGWTLNNEHHNSGSITTILDDCEIIPDYTSEITPIVFPSNPVKQNYTFVGWYTASHGGDKITEYNGEEKTATISGIDASNYTASGNVKTDAGTYEITLTGKGDYAGTKKINWTINKANPSYTVPTGLEATYGQTLADVSLPGAANGTWSWKAALTTSVGNAGTNKFVAVFTPTDTKNYEVKEEEVSVAVAKATTKLYSANNTYS